MRSGSFDPAAALAAARARREALIDDPATDAYRLLHGHGEGRPGVSVDVYGPLVHARVEDPADRAALAPDLLREAVGDARAVVVVVAPGDDPCVDGGRAGDRVVATEHGLHYEVAVGARRNPGLYLDARPARAWVREHATDRRILNLFAWTGGFGVAALAGGARSIVHVDQQKQALARAKRNHERNAQRLDDRDLVREDVYRHLRRAAKAGRRFGGIVLDAPPTVPGRAARGPAGQDHATLVSLALACLAEGGWILCTFSRRDVPRADYEAGILAMDGASGLHVVHRGTSGLDFPEDDPERKLRFDVFARHDVAPTR